MNIKPFEQVKTTVVTSMTVRVMRVELFKSASLYVSLMDANGNIVDTKMVEIIGDDYKKWGSDDTFIYGFIANKLGLSMPDVATNGALAPAEVAPSISDLIALVPPPIPAEVDVPTILENPVPPAPADPPALTDLPTLLVNPLSPPPTSE